MDIDDIKGWDSYAGLYKKWVEQAKDGCRWVESGVFLGRGLIGAAKYAKLLNKKITFYAVDTWQGSDEPEHKRFIEEIGGTDKFFQQFLKNVKLFGVEDLIIPIRKDSIEASGFFDDKSLDIVYLDDSHKFNDVKNGINAWLPKVKDGGIIAGHDIDCFDVKEAVMQTLAEYHDQINDSWIYYK